MAFRWSEGSEAPGSVCAPPTLREKVSVWARELAFELDPAEIVVGRWPDPLPGGWRMGEFYDAENVPDLLDAPDWGLVVSSAAREAARCAEFLRQAEEELAAACEDGASSIRLAELDELRAVAAADLKAARYDLDRYEGARRIRSPMRLYWADTPSP